MILQTHLYCSFTSTTGPVTVIVNCRQCTDDNQAIQVFTHSIFLSITGYAAFLVFFTVEQGSFPIPCWVLSQATVPAAR
ncbi:MAG: hypothetical protein ACYSUY_21440, partial [Planctomycetota bacterium]